MTQRNKTERTNKWLEETMYDLWEEYFNDVPRKNLVIIKFGRRSIRQLGAIKWVTNRTRVKSYLRRFSEQLTLQDDPRISLITITSLYKDPRIPDFVVKETIAHEMIHYAHGFNSPLKQIYNHPHKGGIIRKEMVRRGMEDLYKQSRKWLKENWEEHTQSKIYK